jgi:hypothetical protein
MSCLFETYLGGAVHQNVQRYVTSPPPRGKELGKWASTSAFFLCGHYTNEQIFALLDAVAGERFGNPIRIKEAVRRGSQWRVRSLSFNLATGGLGA